MTINPFNSSRPASPPVSNRAAEGSEATRGGRDVRNDGDGDDAAAAAPKAPAASGTVNAQGEVTGTVVNTHA